MVVGRSSAKSQLTPQFSIQLPRTLWFLNNGFRRAFHYGKLVDQDQNLLVQLQDLEFGAFSRSVTSSLVTCSISTPWWADMMRLPGPLLGLIKVKPQVSGGSRNVPIHAREMTAGAGLMQRPSQIQQESVTEIHKALFCFWFLHLKNRDNNI